MASNTRTLFRSIVNPVAHVEQNRSRNKAIAHCCETVTARAFPNCARRDLRVIFRSRAGPGFGWGTHLISGDFFRCRKNDV